MNRFGQLCGVRAPEQEHLAGVVLPELAGPGLTRPGTLREYPYPSRAPAPVLPSTTTPRRPPEGLRARPRPSVSPMASVHGKSVGEGAGPWVR